MTAKEEREIRIKSQYELIEALEAELKIAYKRLRDLEVADSLLALSEDAEGDNRR